MSPVTGNPSEVYPSNHSSDNYLNSKLAISGKKDVVKVENQQQQQQKNPPSLHSAKKFVLNVHHPETLKQGGV